MANITAQERARRAAALAGAAEPVQDDAPEAAVEQEDEELLRFEMHPDDMPRRTRMSTLGMSEIDKTNLPEHLMTPGWAYAWFAYAVYNEPVETWQTTAIADGLWEPVPARLILKRQHAAGVGARTIIPNDYAGKWVERGGQRLYTRPQSIDDESRREDIARAQRQSSGRLDAARIENLAATGMYQQRAPTESFVQPGVRGMDMLAAEAEMQREASRRSREAQNQGGERVTTSADDISPQEREQYADKYRKPDGRVSL